MKKALFSTSSSNFWVNIFNLVLSALAISGVQFTQPTLNTAAEIVNTFSTTGIVAVIGLVLINVGSPVYHAFIKKSFNFKALLGSTNFWIQFVSAAIAAALLFGLEIPTGTSEQLVGAVFARDWTGLAFVFLSNILNPLIRFFKNKAPQEVA